MIFDHIEEHNESLSKKIQYIVDSVKEIEMKEQKTQRQWKQLRIFFCFDGNKRGVIAMEVAAG